MIHGMSVLKQDLDLGSLEFHFKMAGVYINYAKALLEASKPTVAIVLKYAKVELTPPKLSDIGKIKRGIQDITTGYRTGRWKSLTVKEAWLNTLVTSEVIFWFFIGEIIGKRSIVGYNVPPIAIPTHHH